MKIMINLFQSKKNLIFLAIGVVSILVAGAIIYTILGSQEDVLSGDEAAEKTLGFINEKMLQQGMTASLIEIIEESGLYKIKLKIGEEEFDSYITKDGKVFFPQFIVMEEAENEQSEQQAATEIPKTDKPEVKVFVMTYCPFGLQAQKMFLPVYDLLKNEAEIGVYFVNYIMHDKQEIDENLRQYCIQKEEKDKYSDYLACFVQDGDFEKCLNQTGINSANLADCVLNTDAQYKITEQYQDQTTWLGGQYPRFNVHTDLNEQYGVGGSPTVVINGVVADINPRSPENFKAIICQSFNSEPEACSQILSNEAPSPSFGGGISSSSGGECK